MNKFFLLTLSAFVISGGAVMAQAPAATTTTEIESPDGTTTTVISPGAAAPNATTPATGAPAATTGTTVVVDPPVAIDAITGKPVSNSTAVPEKEESLRDKVRDKMKKD